MITLQQIRAARGLLNWSQSELAKFCGLSVTSMSKIDRGISKPRVTTLEKIQDLFEKQGVEFTSGNGVRMCDEVFNVQICEGEDLHYRYHQDIFNTLRTYGGDAGHIFTDEQPVISNPKWRKALFNYYREFRKYGFSERILLTEGVMERYGPPDCVTYRWCSKELASDAGTSVYGNKYAIFLPNKIVMIENQAIADKFFKQFEESWNNAKPIPSAKSGFEQDLERLSS